MEFSIKKRAEKFLRKQGKKGGKTAAKILAAAVAVVTVAALAMPALTMEKEANCGIEEHTHTPDCYEKVLTCTKGTVEKASLECTLHQHTKECYKDKDPKKELICGYADYAVHHHDKNCYIDGKLVCQLKELEEHQHTDDCYKTEKTLVCGKEESEGHTHSDSCYEEKKELTCGKEESEGHQHGDDCYDEEGNLICEKEESEGHQHSDDCYKVTKELTCGKEESEGHKHSDACYETEKVLKCDKPEIILHQHTQECFNENPDKNHKHTDECKNADGVYVCGGLKCDKIDVRKHQHSDDEIVKPDATHEHTDACYEEQLVCGKEEHTHTEDCYNVEKAQTEDEQKDGEAKEEADGEDDDKVETVAMPETFEYEDENVSVVLHVEGDATVMEESENAEAEGEVDADQTEDQQDGEPKAEADDTAETGEPEENEEMAALGMTEMQDEAEDSQSKETNADDAAADENAENGENAEAEAKETAPVMQVEKLEEGSEQYQEVVNYAEENEGIGEEYNLDVFKFHFYQEGKELDVSNCKINAEVIAKNPMIKPFEKVLDESADAVDGVEVGVMVSALGGLTEEETEFASTLVSKKNAESSVLTVALEDNMLAVNTRGTTNPKFTVQYWAQLPMIKFSDTYNKANMLQVIDTSKKAGGSLPKSSTGNNQGNNNPKTKNIVLKANGNEKGQTETEMQFQEIYTEGNFEYIKTPYLVYFDKLENTNENYEHKSIWVLKKGKNKNSKDSSDFDVYNLEDYKEIQFTNNPNNALNNKGDIARIWIDDGTVIRLVYKPKKENDAYKTPASMYDYDETDGKFYTAKNGNEIVNTQPRDKKVWVKTNKLGINSNVTNSSGKSVFAFGNENTASGWADQTYDGNNINKYNSRSFGGCSFGLVKNHTGKDIIYSDGIVGPSLYGTKAQTGKKALSDKFELFFRQVGDTYTLSHLNRNGSTELSNLDKFENPGVYDGNQHGDSNKDKKIIWTNNFWPVDYRGYVQETNDDVADLMSGGDTKVGIRGTDSNFPPSDDGKAHNSHFGMCYNVDFNLVEDYSGPLEYLFYGDDDMWVFLDKVGSNGQITGPSKLVCDIGGVHSSVGEYVDLWDYIEKGSKGKYRLTFYYTERGESGSSCFMQFTLPSVSIGQTHQTTGSLRVEKEVNGLTSDEQSDQSFEFELEINGDYEEYIKYDHKDNEIGGGTLDTRRGNLHVGKFTLKSGEYIVIRNLQPGCTYSVKETDPGAYKPAVSINGSEEKQEDHAEGNIVGGQEQKVKFVNTPSQILPKTGGSGTMIFTVAGGALIVIAAGVYAEQLRRKRQKSL